MCFQNTFLWFKEPLGGELGGWLLSNARGLVILRCLPYLSTIELEVLVCRSEHAGMGWGNRFLSSADSSISLRIQMRVVMSHLVLTYVFPGKGSHHLFILTFDAWQDCPAIRRLLWGLLCYLKYIGVGYTVRRIHLVQAIVRIGLGGKPDLHGFAWVSSRHSHFWKDRNFMASDCVFKIAKLALCVDPCLQKKLLREDGT